MLQKVHPKMVWLFLPFGFQRNFRQFKEILLGQAPARAHTHTCTNATLLSTHLTSCPTYLIRLPKNSTYRFPHFRLQILGCPQIFLHGYTVRSPRFTNTTKTGSSRQLFGRWQRNGLMASWFNLRRCWKSKLWLEGVMFTRMWTQGICWAIRVLANLIQSKEKHHFWKCSKIVDLMAPVTSVSHSLLLPVRSTPCRNAWWPGSILCMTPATSVGRCELSLLDTIQLHSHPCLTFLNPFQFQFVDNTALWYGTLRFLPATWCLLQFKMSPWMPVSSHSKLSKMWNNL